MEEVVHVPFVGGQRQKRLRRGRRRMMMRIKKRTWRRGGAGESRCKERRA